MQPDENGCHGNFEQLIVSLLRVGPRVVLRHDRTRFVGANKYGEEDTSR